MAAKFDINEGFNGDVKTIAIQADGKILIGGYFTSYAGSGNTFNYIVRLKSNGGIDNTFNIGTGFDNTLTTIAIQSDDKILIGGMFSNYNGITANRIIRLNPNGSVDTTFVTGTGFEYDNGTGYDNWVYSIAIQSDGKILVGGYLFKYNGITIGRDLVRLNSDGSVDNTFVTGTGFDEFANGIYSIAIQSSGKILVGGRFSEYKDITVGKNIIRLNPNGSVDTTFITGTGTTSDTFVFGIAIQSDGKILLCGDFYNYNGTSSRYLVRLNSDGSIDNTFAYSFNGQKIYAIAIQSDGKILIGGQFTKDIIRLNPDSTVDNTFAIGAGFNDLVWTMAIQTDGKILVGGAFRIFDMMLVSCMIRLNSDGSSDNTINQKQTITTTRLWTKVGYVPGATYTDYEITLQEQQILELQQLGI